MIEVILPFSLVSTKSFPFPCCGLEFWDAFSDPNELSAFVVKNVEVEDGMIIDDIDFSGNVTEKLVKDNVGKK